MARLNREYDLDICNHVIVKYGSVNKDNPQVIYITGKCWITATNDMIDHEKVIDKIEHKMKKNIRLFFMDGSSFQNKYILDFDLNTESMYGTKKFFSFGIYLRQNDNEIRTLKNIREVIENKASSVVNSLVYSLRENGFMVERSKKRR